MAETGFPGPWAEWPTNVKRVVLQRLRDTMLERMGPGGLLQWLYAGSTRPDGTRVPLNVRPAECWPLALEDAAAADRAPGRSGE